jgi:hypothetical protein
MCAGCPTTSRDAATAGDRASRSPGRPGLPPLRGVDHRKLAVTDFAAVIVTAQTLFRPEQAPDQPLKTEPAEAVAVR